MATFIDFSNSSTNILGKQTNNSDQSAIIRWPIVPRVAKLKINVAQGKHAHAKRLTLSYSFSFV